MGFGNDDLKTVIGADADPLIKGLKDAERALNNFQRTSKSSFAAVESAAHGLSTIIGVSLAGGMAEFARRSIESVSRLKDQADQIGINVERFQALKFAAQQAGVSEDDFSSGLNKLSRLLGDAATGSLQAQDAFAKWGVSIRDTAGNLLPVEEVLAEISDRFASISNPALRSAAAVDLFAKNGASMINFLSQGSAEMGRMEEKARSMGAVIDKETVKKAKEATDQLSAMATVITADLAPAIIAILEPLSKLAQLIGEAGKGAKLIGAIFTGAGTKKDGNISENFMRMMENIDPNLKGGQTSPLKIAVSPQKTAGGFQPGNPAGTRALDNYLQKLKELHDFNSLTVRDQEIQRAVAQAEAIARENNVRITGEYIEKVREAAAANFDQVESVRQLKDISRDLSSAFTSAFDDMVSSGKSFGDMLKSLENSLVSLLMKMAVQKPLESAFSGFFGGGSSGGGLLDKLGGGIGKIFGFADGGSPPVGRPSIVGENGPELFIPNRAGTIIPNGASMGGGGVTVVQHLNIMPDVSGNVRQQILAYMPQISSAAAAAVADRTRRGGSYAAAVRG